MFDTYLELEARMEGYTVHTIERKDAKPWIMKKHYAKRMPAVQHSFGLFNNYILEGVICYGPTCRSLNQGYGAFGEKKDVSSFELLRLCIDSENKNAASFLVSNSIKLLPKPAFIVSYADGNMGHLGYVYQATNWLYCGITATERVYIDERTGKTVHPRTVVSLFGSRKAESLPEYIRTETEGNGKHRYIYFTGSKKQKKEMLKALRYPVLPYPKGKSKRYDASAEFPKQVQMF